jgi:hypothetical protein
MRPGTAVSVAAAGQNAGMFRWLSGLFQKPRDEAETQQGGVQDEEYRSAAPVDVVEADGIAMAGPGGSPPEELSPDERRDRDRSSSS